MNVLVVDAGGVYRISFSGNYVQPNGDLDFSGASLDGRAVKIVFSIAKGSTPGVRFPANPSEAMWIVDKAQAGPTGEPTAPYQGTQFSNFASSATGRRIEVLDTNDDGRTYQYALHFDVPTQIGKIDQPEPVFAEANRSTEFDAPSVSGDSLMFVDQDEYANAYEYAIGLNGPNGRVVMDPKISNGGTHPPLPTPEPIPQ